MTQIPAPPTPSNHPSWPRKAWDFMSKSCTGQIIIIIATIITTAIAVIQVWPKEIDRSIHISEPAQGKAISRCVDIIYGTGVIEEDRKLWIAVKNTVGALRLATQAKQDSTSGTGRWHADSINLGAVGETGMGYEIIAMSLDANTDKSLRSAVFDLTGISSANPIVMGDGNIWRLVFTQNSMPSTFHELDSVHVVRNERDQRTCSQRPGTAETR